MSRSSQLKLRSVVQNKITEQMGAILEYKLGRKQLEAEIARNGWLHCSADHDLLFDLDVTSKYERAVKKLGFDPQLLSSTAGHA